VRSILPGLICSTLGLLSIASIAQDVSSPQGVTGKTVTAPPLPGPQMRGDGPPPAAQSFRIERIDPALDALIAPDAKLELLASGFGLNEGPVWVRDGKSGYLLVSGLLDNVIYKITPDRNVSVFLDYAGYTGNNVSDVGTQTRSGRSHVLLVGPSCTSIDGQGRLVWCADNDLAIMRLEQDGTRTILANGINGKHFNGPNDLVIKSDGAIYITDNDFGLRYAGKSPQKQLPDAIWLVKDGRTEMVLEDKALGGIPNGIALSADERYLYLTAGRKLKRYEVRADDTLGENILVAEGDGIGDGMKVDRRGDIFSSGGAGPGIIRITSPEGKLLGFLHLPIYGGEPKKQICATNDAFGGPDGRTLFIAACDVVYKIQLRTVGIVPGPPAGR
jgi:gluconolactonase